MSNLKKYKKYLSEVPEFIFSADKVFNSEYDKEKYSDSFHAVSAYVTSPVLTAYTMFILSECVKRNIKRIYFMARDGKILFKIARVLCKKQNIDIDCRYIYCSRASLRMPSYHIIGDEAFDILLMNGFCLNAFNVLARAELSENERIAVYNDIEFNSENEKKYFSREDFEDFKARLKKSEVYKNIVMEKSEKSYKSAVSYFIQEGLTDGISFAVADTGWTGSMQRSLGQILSHHAGKNVTMTGFYFGMYSPPKSSEYGEYISWYFSYNSSAGLMSKFNNNLFECMCCADHGMTKGYEEKNGTYVPVMNSQSERNAELAIHQMNCAEYFADVISELYNVRNLNEFQLHTFTEKILSLFMYKPEKAEAEAFGEFTFCDDITEAYLLKLAEPNKNQEIKNSLFYERVSAKLSGKRRKDELFWSYGTLALSDIEEKSWYRINLNLWERAKFLINR